MSIFLPNPFLQFLLFTTLVWLLTGCGSGGGDSQTSGTIRSAVETLDLFEGETHTVSSGFAATDVHWEQVSGPVITIDATSDAEVIVTIPWVLQGPSSAVIQAAGMLDGQPVSKRFEIRILDRRYLAMRVHDNSSGTTDLYLQYVSANDEEGVPDLSTVRLTTLEPNAAICSYSISPSGQYVAYSISDIGGGFLPVCRGLYIVDIETGISQKLSKLGLDGQEVVVDFPRWSPDGTRIAYLGDHGEGVTQIYSIDIAAATTSYINYGNNLLTLAQWPAEDLFPIDDGGNPYGLEFVDDQANPGLTWLNNGTGLAFEVIDSDSADAYPYLASVHGDARKLHRLMSIREYIHALDDEAAIEYRNEILSCPDGGVCAALPLLNLPLLLIDSDYNNPESLESSIDGHLMFIATMVTNAGDPYKVLSVSEPVIDNADSPNNAPIEAIDVFDAAWSPTAVDLAFASGSEIRHAHSEDSSVPLGQLTAIETPGQLYLYQNYRHGHAQPQERLAYPRPTIDSNPVIALEWSDDGSAIAYVRGESGEGDRYTSLWVTAVDTVRDESEGAIDANTVLLSNLSDSIGYMTDFIWAPDGSGLLAMLNTDEGHRILRYMRRDASGYFDSPTLIGATSDLLLSVAATFSPDGQYYAYLDEADVSGVSMPALFVQSVAGDSRIRISVDLPGGESISKVLQWSPYGDAVVYTINSIGGFTSYLARVDGTNQNLDGFFDPDQTILQIRG